MSRLLEAQQRFAQQAAMLIRAAYVRGYEVTEGDSYRNRRVYDACAWAFAHGYRDAESEQGIPPPACHPNSNHFRRLARDLNVFRGSTLLSGAEATAAYNELHDLWDTLGGAPRIPEDLNHFSFAFDGMR